MLGGWEDDGEVDRNEDSVLHGIGVADEEIGTHTILVTGRDEVVKLDESLLESLWWVVVQTREEDSEDCGEVLLNGGSGEVSLSLRLE